MDGYPRRKYKMTVGILNEKWNACLLLMLLQNGIVFFKCFTCLLRSIKVSANTLSKNKQSGHKFLAAALPGTIPKGGWELVPRLAPRPPRVLRAIAANTPRAAFALLRCSSVTRPLARPPPPASARASVVDLSSPCSLSRLQVSKRSETEAESTVPSKLFSGKIPPPLR